MKAPKVLTSLVNVYTALLGFRSSRKFSRKTSAMLTTLSQSTLRIELSVLREQWYRLGINIPPVSRPIFFARERREVRLLGQSI
jgi:hypothetical protein